MSILLKILLLFVLSEPSNELGKTVNTTSKSVKAKVQSIPRSSPDISGKTQVSWKLIVAGDKATNLANERQKVLTLARVARIMVSANQR